MSNPTTEREPRKDGKGFHRTRLEIAEDAERAMDLIRYMAWDLDHIEEDGLGNEVTTAFASLARVTRGLR